MISSSCTNIFIISPLWSNEPNAVTVFRKFRPIQRPFRRSTIPPLQQRRNTLLTRRTQRTICLAPDRAAQITDKSTGFHWINHLSYRKKLHRFYIQSELSEYQWGFIRVHFHFLGFDRRIWKRLEDKIFNPSRIYRDFFPLCRVENLLRLSSRRSGQRPGSFPRWRDPPEWRYPA